jgi:hypothetical protein
MAGLVPIDAKLGRSVYRMRCGAKLFWSAEHGVFHLSSDQ